MRRNLPNMIAMRILLLLLTLVCHRHQNAHAQVPDGFKPLFNGKNLKGWHISRTSHQGTTGNFYVEDGAIVLKQDPYGQGGVLLTDRRYKNFELYVEVKIDSFCNGGIFLRSTESGQAYQVELATPGGTGSLLGEAMHISKTAKAVGVENVWKAGDWNAFRIKMTGDIPRLTLWINDVLMWEVVQPENDFIAGATEGMIGLQSHWTALYEAMPGSFNMAGSWRAGAAHRFRNIGIREIPGAQE